ncbi:hypothetical protein O6H91_14G058400 [Diphasiastrum complanatum]|uniref:Uncharacterized protein n=1 Tax=Diphasiastrum complanatum TaxID=34168 RepID=A0ACC2BQ26_DIPCM|nr:hypothetical protein O6H91_14G058400 [Diphasiastrum complanatum]
MGTLVGHVAPGVGFALIGLVHLLNTIRNYAQSPWDFESRSWFPTKAKGKLKYWSYILLCSDHLSPDWSIPSEHLNNFEHSSISLFFLLYADDCSLLLFHLHSADHMGLEGQYHWLYSSLSFFLVALIRSMALLFQGWWFIQMGLVLWIPAFTPKGCKMNNEDNHKVFSWYLAAIVIFTLIIYAYMVTCSKTRAHYLPLDHKDGISNMEVVRSAELAEICSAPKHRRSSDGSHSSAEMEAFASVERLER